MQPSRRQFLTGALALGATKALAQDEEKLPHTLDLATEQKRWAALVEAERAQGELTLQIEKTAWEEGRQFDKQNWEAERRDMLDRYKLCAKLGRILLSRYMVPLDDWLNLSGFLKEPEFEKKDVFFDPEFKAGAAPAWFLLKVSSDALKGRDLWMKFSYAEQDLGMIWVEEDDPEQMPDEEGNRPKIRKMVKETVIQMMWRKRDALLEALEHHFILLMEDEEGPDEEAIHTMVNGTAGLYRLVSESSDPSTVTKAQLLR